MSSRLIYRMELIMSAAAGAMYQARSVWYIVMISDGAKELVLLQRRRR